MRSVVLASALVLLGGGTLGAQGLPDGAGRVQLGARCTGCHETDLVSQQRLTRAAWGRSLDKMVGWGAMVSADDREILLDYLSAHFGPTPIASHTSTTEGETVFRRACVLCHESDLATQQRLTRAAWVRSVDKMIGWGAVVAPSEKDALVDYLAARHHP